MSELVENPRPEVSRTAELNEWIIAIVDPGNEVHQRLVGRIVIGYGAGVVDYLLLHNVLDDPFVLPLDAFAVRDVLEGLGVLQNIAIPVWKREGVQKSRPLDGLGMGDAGEFNQSFSVIG